MCVQVAELVAARAAADKATAEAHAQVKRLTTEVAGLKRQAEDQTAAASRAAAALAEADAAKAREREEAEGARKQAAEAAAARAAAQRDVCELLDRVKQEGKRGDELQTRLAAADLRVRLTVWGSKGPCAYDMYDLSCPDTVTTTNLIVAWMRADQGVGVGAEAGRRGQAARLEGAGAPPGTARTHII